jgi:hypothetical protein
VTRTAVLIASLAVALGGCLDRLSGYFVPECDTHADCNTTRGEVCEEGVCWGDPPEGPFAVAIAPPAGDTTVALTETTAIAIQDDGWITGLVMSSSVMLRGRIAAVCEGCRDGVAVPAEVRVRRASRISGAPEFRVTTYTAASEAGDSFAIPVPPLDAADLPYQLTILPLESAPVTPGGPSAASVIPPVRLTVGADQLGAPLAITLGGDDVVPVAGRVVDSVGQGIAGMRIYALGHLTGTDRIDRLSTLATSDAEGWFTLRLSAPREVIDVIAEPPSGVPGAPVLIARNRFLGSGPLVLRMPSYPATTRISLPVVSTDPSGGVSAVAHADVELTTTITDPVDGASQAVFTVSGQTDTRGFFEADVVAGGGTGARVHAAKIVPPPESSAASVLAHPVEVGDQGGVVATVALGRRSAITGVVLDASGAPVVGVSVSASPSLRFLWSLRDPVQATIRGRPAPTIFTANDGSFRLWVDPEADGVAARYDVTLQPPQYSGVPRDTVPDLDAGANVSLGEVWMPDTAFVRGDVTSPYGWAIGDATVVFYEMVSDLTACIAQNAPTDCRPPPRILATGQSDSDGIVRLALPRR